MTAIDPPGVSSCTAQIGRSDPSSSPVPPATPGQGQAPAENVVRDRVRIASLAIANNRRRPALAIIDPKL
ncbi:MAG: hypothetical protein AVDCRST_MAG73-3426 [uncultured Thermomicrobiales bacterium]|uniref:Uncharacterized protein n=1 Tax=uncultured Thermomicrobiales bacterium TaxID=1645740 RepID=A0A6J4US33_9BACT|nr:MAG: hypothetical protein AVDCRST_MAG73-3426 [uncultured Thermomicrobiales bacterium]